MEMIENPVRTCDKVYALIQSLTSQIRRRLEDPKSAGGYREWVELTDCMGGAELTDCVGQTCSCTTARPWS